MGKYNRGKEGYCISDYSCISEELYAGMINGFWYGNHSKEDGLVILRMRFKKKTEGRKIFNKSKLNSDL